VYSMGIYRQLPDRLRQLHPRYGTPWIGIILFGTAACLLLIPVTPLFLLLLALVYGAADLVFALSGAMNQREGKLLGAITLPFLFPAVHVVYGAGTLCGLFTPEKGAPHA